MLNILFVCTGNTCRSVMAEALLRHYWEREGDDRELKISSAGLAAIPGDQASEHVHTLLSEEGVDVSAHEAALLNDALVEKAELILVMTAGHKEALLARFPQAGSKTYLLKEYAGINASNLDVADPFGCSLAKYRHALEEIRESIAKLMVKLKGGGADEGRSGR